MDKTRIKSSELVIIKKIIAWQAAQIVGYKDENELKKHGKNSYKMG